ncbi:MAG TPA: phosphatase PAP2 family protein, partial [Thermomicrobiales bacterium]|nr:phosphatase PAP2 family protein [Thermomicrobiales bacterium]
MASFPTPRLSRRALVGASLAGAAILPLTSIQRTLAGPPGGGAPLGAAAASSPPSWRTWVLTSAGELRPAAPAAPTKAELEEIVTLQNQRTDETIATIRLWGGRPAIFPWTDLANDAYNEFKLTAIRQYRANAILQAAMYDAVLAAYDAQDAYNQPAPAKLDDRITPLEGIGAARPAYPSEHAAIAGAAAAVLTALLPDATAGRFTGLANEAAMSRVQAGVNTRRDIDAGLALGTTIGERAFALAKDDRPGSAWDGTGRLNGPGYWQPTPPAMIEKPMEPLAGTWHRWVLTSGDQFRPAPPPKYGSPE